MSDIHREAPRQPDTGRVGNAVPAVPAARGTMKEMHLVTDPPMTLEWATALVGQLAPLLAEMAADYRKRKAANVVGTEEVVRERQVV